MGEANKILCFFPYGIYYTGMIRDYITYKGPESFYFSYQGKTVRDNKYLGFTFFPEDWPKFKEYKESMDGNKSIPFQERWSSRHFTLDKIFNLDIIDIDKK